MATTVLPDPAGPAPAREGRDRRIVVGVDGSAGARAALVWALATAARSGAGVEVVAALPPDVYGIVPRILDRETVEAVRSDTAARARAFVAEALSDPAVASVPRAASIPVHFVVVIGAAAESLVERADGADLLVVGSRGRGALRSTLLGSVALSCAAHARCPVVVVHPARRPDAAPVMVGIDDSPAARAALVRAVEEAARLGAPVEAVVAYTPVDYWSDLDVVTAPALGELREEALSRTQGIVTEVLGPAPSAPVRVVAEQGAPAEVLVRRSADAALLVLGSRSRSRLAGMLLGSVALRCVVSASCPVMVVPPEPASRAADRADEADSARG